MRIADGVAVHRHASVERHLLEQVELDRVVGGDPGVCSAFRRARDTSTAGVEVQIFLGDHWSFLVLRALIFGERRYFRELLAGSLEGIASDILAGRLKRFVAAGILTRDDAVCGQHARYSLTEVGMKALPIIDALGNWGLDWRTGSPELRTPQKLMRAEGTRFIDKPQPLTRHHVQPQAP